ncbi:hypothetical protein ACFL13_02100 [Patescibacteria group bacterium]
METWTWALLSGGGIWILGCVIPERKLVLKGLLALCGLILVVGALVLLVVKNAGSYEILHTF